MKTERFSRKTLAKDLFARMEQLESKYGFTVNDGWAQVHGKGETINRAYGEYDMLQKILDAFSLWGIKL